MTCTPSHLSQGERLVRTTFLYKLFRPEFVKQYPIPLSSDAFSNFARHDPKRKEHEQEIIEATVHKHHKHIPSAKRVLIAKRVLKDETIPTCARIIEQNYSLSALTQDLTLLTEIVHRSGMRKVMVLGAELLPGIGVNIRYLGLLRKSCTSAELQSLILMEMVARYGLKTLLCTCMYPNQI